MRTQILTGYTGEAHMTAAREAMIWKGLFGDGNYARGIELEVDCEAGTVIISSGTFIFSGKFGVIEDPITFTYGAPTGFCKVGIAVKYAQDENAIESFDVIYEKSNDFGTLEGAQNASIQYTQNGVYSESITPQTVEAYFPLYELVISGTSDCDESKMYSDCDNLDRLSIVVPAYYSSFERKYVDAVNENEDNIDEAKTQILNSFGPNALHNICRPLSQNKSYNNNSRTCTVTAPAGSSLDYDLYVILYRVWGSSYGSVLVPKNGGTLCGPCHIYDTNNSNQMKITIPKFDISIASNEISIVFSNLNLKYFYDGGFTQADADAVTIYVDYVYGVRATNVT